MRKAMTKKVMHAAIKIGTSSEPEDGPNLSSGGTPACLLGLAL
jgi:hypothetical protein